jgi:hypothetical protein
MVRVARPNLRQFKLRTVAVGTCAEMVGLAMSGVLKHGDVVFGLDPSRPVPAHEVPELTGLVPGPVEAEAWRRFCLSLAFAAIIEAYLFAVLLGSGGMATVINWVHEVPLLIMGAALTPLAPIAYGYQWYKLAASRAKFRRARG